MGGTGASLDAALSYSHWVFAGAVLVWLFNSLAAVIRGTGNMARAGATSPVAGVVLLVPLSPLLIFGWGPVPGLGIAGGAMALLLYYLLRHAGAGGLPALAPQPAAAVARAACGCAGRCSATSCAVGLVGADVDGRRPTCRSASRRRWSGHFGAGAIAGYGTASRLEYLLVPLVFGLGAPLVAMVGTCIGAGQRERALRATWTGAAIAFVLTEAIGARGGAVPAAWLLLFGNDPAMLDAGTHYLRVGRAVLRLLRRRAGAVFRVAGRGPAAVAGAGQPRAAGGGRHRRLAGAALSGALASVRGAGGGAGGVRRGHRLRHRGRRLVRAGGLAAHDPGLLRRLALR